jgi:hypothetical protein
MLIFFIYHHMSAWLKTSYAGDRLAGDPNYAMAILLASKPPAIEVNRVRRTVKAPRDSWPEHSPPKRPRKRT